MRHRKHRNKLGLNKSHRLAVVRNLATQLLQYEKIVTTLARGKVLSMQIDKLVTLAKKKDLSSRRRVLSFVKNKIAVKKLYEEYSVIYQERHSGFTRAYKIKHRLGDNAAMVLITMVDRENIVKEQSQPTGTESTLKQVKKDVEKTTEQDSSTQKIASTKKQLSHTTKVAAIKTKSTKKQASKKVSTKVQDTKSIQGKRGQRDNKTSKG